MNSLLVTLFVLASPVDPREALVGLSCARLDALAERQSFHVASLRRYFDKTCSPVLELTDERCSALSTALIENFEDLVYVERILSRKGCRP